MTKPPIQPIRRSQFVLTYGPGAIIESRNGPRIIPSIGKGLIRFSLDNLIDYRISDNRLKTILKNLRNSSRPSEVFSLPSNASLRRPDTSGVYSTYLFPRWKICYGRKKGHNPVLYGESKCPKCGRTDDSSAVRFVAACPNGHLDEVQWSSAVHWGKKKKCSPRYFYWKSRGSSLSDIVIECPECGANTNMKEIYRLDFSCTGRFPEKEQPIKNYGRPYVTETDRPKNCNRTMKVLQRQSSSLRFPTTITLLTIPEYDNQISNVLQRKDITNTIELLSNMYSSGSLDEEGVKKHIKELQKIPENTINVIENHIVENGIDDLFDLYYKLNSEERKFVDFIYEEFESLLQGSRVSENFTVSPPEKITDETGTIPNLLVYPVEKLRTVTAQEGYTRLSDVQGREKVFSSVYFDDSNWYPGFEGIGEGLFITFGDKKPDFENNKAYEVWNTQENPENLGNPLWEDIPQQPLFVWLHTLSHAIIRRLALYSGYSSASLRERVYIDRTASNGGILIYTTSPGEDGSLGGLIGMVSNFNEVLKRALEDIHLCSNDPLCFEVRKDSERVNGAACYSCLFTSETSCEHRNMWLDRHMITGD